MDYLQQFGCRAFEHRLGPFIAKCADANDDACGETLWFTAGIGGGYNADGSINEKFGDAVEAAVSYGDSNGWYQGINVIDTWGCKVSQNGNPYNPWITLAPQALANCGSAWDSVQDTWLRYWVKRLTKYPHVYWQLDNEGDLVRKPRQEWWDAQLAAIRDEEKKNGINVHLTTCTPAFGGGCDFLYTHDVGPVSVIDGKFTLKNEYNPDHYNPGETVSNIIDADRAPSGVSMSFWQDDATDAQSIATLEGIKAGFAGHPVGCYAPDGNDPLWQDPPTDPSARPPQMMAAFNAAKAVVGDRCGAQGKCTPAREPCAPPTFIGCIDTSDLIAAELRKQSCASGSWGGGPEIALLAPDGWWEQYHPCATETGCYTGNPYKFAWKYKGTNPTPPTPTPPSACGDPQPPPLESFGLKVHVIGPTWTTFDATPLVHNLAYCTSIGFVDRVDCPVRQEGAADRAACETQIVGSPVWSGPGEVSPEGPYLYRVKTGTKGQVKVCASAEPLICSTINIP
jgi:hypothetical protein